MPPGTRRGRRASGGPTRRFSARDARTHGPAMRNSASLRNRTIAASVCCFDQRALPGSAFASATGLGGGGDEAGEQRMRTRGARLQLGMELTANEPRMRLQLDDLDELSVW